MIQNAALTEITNTTLARSFNRLGDRIHDLSQLRNYGSLTQQISEYAHELGKELSLNPSRSIYLDQAIRRNELHEKDLEIVYSAVERLKASSFNLF
jgi:hypothetical protein